MRFRQLPLLGALALATPAFAVTVNMTDFTFPSNPRVVDVSGGTSGPSYSGAAGEFSGTFTDTAAAASARGSTLGFNALDATSPTSFVAWCGELTQSFSFNTTYTYDRETGLAHYGAARTDALSRLFTAAQGFVVDATTSAAMQAGIWEIIYEQGNSYDLTGGSFVGSMQDPAGLVAFNTLNGFLTHLSTYSASYRIDVLGNESYQDFIVATAPVPEPETWALLMAGFGVMGWAARRRKAAAAG